MRRAAVSSAANIAGGFAQRSQAEKARFLNVAEGSIEESRYFLIGALG
jgi:four helix bundle protein